MNDEKKLIGNGNFVKSEYFDLNMIKIYESVDLNDTYKLAGLFYEKMHGVYDNGEKYVAWTLHCDGKTIAVIKPLQGFNYMSEYKLFEETTCAFCMRKYRISWYDIESEPWFCPFCGEKQ